MVKTMGVQPFIFLESSPYFLIEAIHDILKYLDQDIIIHDDHAFLDRKDISLTEPFIGTVRQKQYYTNGLLISGLFETLENEEFSKIEQQFNDLINTVSNILNSKLENKNLSSTHSVFIDKDEQYGDIVIGFWKKE